MEILKKYAKVSKGNAPLYLWGMLCVLVTSILGFVYPKIIGYVIDFVSGTNDVESIGYVNRLADFLDLGSYNKEVVLSACIFVLVISLLNAIFSFLRTRSTAIASENIAKDIRNRLYSHMQQLPFSYHSKSKSGDLIQRSTSDVETIRKFLANTLISLFEIITKILAATYFMFTLNVSLTWIALCGFPVIFFATFFLFKSIHSSFKKADEEEGKLSTILQENLNGMNVVRAFGRQKFEYDKYNKQNKVYSDGMYKVIKSEAVLWAVSDMVAMMMPGVVSVAAILMAVSGNVSAGVFFVFISYTTQLLWPLQRLARIMGDMGKSNVSLDRIYEILEQEPEDMQPDGKKPDISKEIRFENVSFAYEENDMVLKNLDLTIKPGETISILGGTGSGKSTLVHLLQRLYDPTEGRIFINDVDITEINKEYLRKNVGIVLQEPFLFSRTLFENIRLANHSATKEEVDDISEIAALTKTISEFKNGYETEVGERGVTLSGGQKQRVAIARTLIRNCKILIFDDSLSAVDTETDARIRRALRDRNKDTTTIIISHRINTLSQADRIFVMDEGRIVNSGTHQELIRVEGMYKRIYDMQSEIKSSVV